MSNIEAAETCLEGGFRCGNIFRFVKGEARIHHRGTEAQRRCVITRRREDATARKMGEPQIHTDEHR
jgi:hypothetical protein